LPKELNQCGALMLLSGADCLTPFTRDQRRLKRCSSSICTDTGSTSPRSSGVSGYCGGVRP